MTKLKLANTELLHPAAIKQFEELCVYLEHMRRAGETETRFLPFHTYRSPAEQNLLYNSGRGVTKVKAFEGAHQYGLAADFVPVIVDEEGNDKWSWEKHHDYPFLKRAARKFGLDVPIKWDLCHVEHPLWKQIRALW